MRHPLENPVFKCLRCRVPVGPDARQWHFTRYTTRADIRVCLCRRCDLEREDGCAVCRGTPLASIPLCVECLIERETNQRLG